MSTSPQLNANRANSLLSTGPRTDAGKLASSRNAQSHGLTTRDALLPGEDLAAYHEHHEAYVDHFRPSGPLDIEAVTEIADLRWRLRRVPVYEAQLISLEIHRLKTDADLKPLLQGIESESQILTLAFSRLIETKALTNLFNLESRLARRIDKLQTRLEFGKRDRLEKEMQARVRAARAERTAAAAAETKPVEEIAEEPNEIGIPQNEAIRQPVVITSPPRPQPIRIDHKVGRNESCPCGSGLKFKRCCLQRTPHALASHA